MSKFDPDPNRPGWGTYTNDEGKPAYDYFPNMAPQSQAQFPSAAAQPNASMPPAAAPNASVPNQSMAPEPAAAPADHSTGAGLLASLDATNKKLGVAPKMPISGMSTTTVAGRSAAGVARDKATLGANNAASQATNTAIGNARADRQTEAAQSQENAAMSSALTAAGDLSKNLGEQAVNQQKLSDTLVEKDPEVQPGRLVQNMSTGTKVATTLIAALTGGFSAVAGIKGNPALDAIEREINADIDSQKEQINSGRIRRGNLIQAYRERGMDLRQAETAARATILDATRRHAQAQEAELGAAAHKEDAQLLNQALEAKYAEQVMALDASQESRSQTTVERKPVAVGKDAGLENFTKQLAARKAYEEAGADADQLATFDKAMGIPSPGGESETARGKREASEKRNEDQSKAAGAMAGINGFATDAGLVTDTKTGDFSANAGDTHTFNARQRERMNQAGGLNVVASKKLERAADAAIEGFGRVQSGGVISDDEAVRFHKMIAESTTDAQLAESLNAIRRIVMPRLAAQDQKTMGGKPAPASWEKK